MSENGDTPHARSEPPEPCVRRGRQALSPEELRAHLAAVVRLENVGVLLGAGASIVLGGKTMDAIWKEFSETYVKSKEWLEANDFLVKGKKVNIEKLIDALAIARIEWERLDRSEHLSELCSTRLDLLRTVVNASILKPKWWKNPSTIQNHSEKLADHRQLLHKLSAARQPGQPSPWVFTTNYDVAIEWAAETIGLKVINGFEGLHRRTFYPHNFDLDYRNILARGEARFGTYGIRLAKLHGSLTWHIDRNGTPIEHSTSYLWNRISGFLDGTNDLEPKCIVYPSTGKYQRTAGFVSGELIRRFTEFVATPQSCLIVSGISFSDEHINRVLESGLRNPTLQIVVCLPEVRCGRDGPDFKHRNRWIKWMASLESPRVTIIGGGSAAYFRTLVDYLPDPVIFDEQSEKMREMMKKYKAFMGSSHSRDENGGET